MENGLGNLENNIRHNAMIYQKKTISYIMNFPKS